VWPVHCHPHEGTAKPALRSLFRRFGPRSTSPGQQVPCSERQRKQKCSANHDSTFFALRNLEKACLGAKTLQFNCEVCCVAIDLIPGRYEEACGLCCRNLLWQVQSSTLSISSPIGSSSAFARKSSPDKPRCSTAKHSVQQSVIPEAQREKHNARSTTHLFQPCRCSLFAATSPKDRVSPSGIRFELTVSKGRFAGSV